MTYTTRIGMAHRIDHDGVTFLPGEAPGNALAQFEGWVEKIVQEEVEKRTLEIRCELVRAREDYLRGYALIGASDLSNFLAKCQQAKGFEEREYDLECEIARLKPMAYPTREAAMQALRDAIATVKKGEEERP